MADTDQVLNLAAIIRKVDGNHSKGAAALAESILDHPRFRAVLAGEPAVPEGREPAAATGQLSDEELLKLAQQYSVVYLLSDGSACNPFQEGYDMRNDVLNFARAVLARWGTSNLTQTWRSPADGEVAELVADLQECADSCILSSKPYWAEPMRRAAELLQRLSPPQPLANGEVGKPVAWMCPAEPYFDGNKWHDQWQVTLDQRLAEYWARPGKPTPLFTRAAELLQRQTLVPVSVSERLPGPEDCAPWPQPSDKSGWCWMSRTVHGFYGSFAIWEQVSVVPMCREVYTHWLPAHALPLPEVGE